MVISPPTRIKDRSYPNFSFARPITKKPTFLRLRGLFEYEIQSWKYSIPLFFTTPGFDTFRNREISTGAGAIREQLADLDLRIILENSLVEWKELGEEGSTGNEWEDRSLRRSIPFRIRNRRNRTCFFHISRYFFGGALFTSLSFY